MDCSQYKFWFSNWVIYPCLCNSRWRNVSPACPSPWRLRAGDNSWRRNSRSSRPFLRRSISALLSGRKDPIRGHRARPKFGKQTWKCRMKLEFLVQRGFIRRTPIRTKYPNCSPFIIEIRLHIPHSLPPRVRRLFVSTLVCTRDSEPVFAFVPEGPDWKTFYLKWISASKSGHSVYLCLRLD